MARPRSNWAALAWLAKEVHTRYPADHVLAHWLSAGGVSSAAEALSAVLNARAADISSIEQERAAVLKRE